MNDKMKFYLGRAVAWLESMHAGGLGNDDSRPKIKKIIDDIHVDQGNVLFHYGKAITWLEVMGASLEDPDKEKVFKLLSEMKELQEQFTSSK